jgi:hypothetical protein
MKLSGKEDQTIRQFLLGRLSEKEQEQVEDRIFSDPDFAEEVQIVEHELMADERAGALTADESRSFSSRYSTKVNRTAMQLEQTFSEFVCSKAESLDTVREVRIDTVREVRVDSPPAPPVTHPAQRTGFWPRLIPTIGPAVVYPTVAIGVLLLAGAIWFFVPYFQHSGNGPSRQAIEAELALLNSQGAPPSVLSTVDLEVAQRYGGAMARIKPRTTSPDEVLEFKLNLAEMNNRKYRAVIFDDRRKELFAISDLTAQDSETGPRIRLFIPSKYLSHGDYQIELNVPNSTGGYDQVNSYAFRMVDPR